MYPKWQVHWDFIEISALVPLSFIGKNTVEGSVHTLFIDVSNNEMFNINDISVSVSIVKFLSPESQEDTSDSDLCNLLANSFCDKPLFFSAFPIFKAIIIRLLVFLSATLSIFDRRSYNTFFINIIGSPCSGKSTVAANLFAELKKLGTEAELITEYAKDCVWENSIDTLEDQIFVFGNQFHRQKRIDGKVQFAVNDSPFLLSSIYNKMDSIYLDKLIIEQYKKFN